MKTFQSVYQAGQWLTPLEAQATSQLVFAFGDRQLIQDPKIRADLHECFPQAQVVGCTTSGEISGSRIYDESLCITAMTFVSTKTQVVSASVSGSSLELATENLVSQLELAGLKHILVFSDGQMVNGTELVDQLQKRLPAPVKITGGLAGDGTNFSETMVWHNDNVAAGNIVLCAFYGDAIQIGYGSIGGWDAFGPERHVTASENNVLYSLDGKPALQLYKKYLGDNADNLPASALLFPLVVKHENGEDAVIRTILNINEDDGSMIFAGDIPQNSRVQLMHANFDRLIGGAEQAAEYAQGLLSNQTGNGFILMVSCVGRRLILGERTEEELEVIQDIFGKQCAYTGFYSYGEISPLKSDNRCALHNQTMTITAFFEKHA